MVGAKPFLLAKMTWPEAEALLAQTDIAIIPVGSTEQHGPALPVDTDAFEADAFAQAVAECALAVRPSSLEALNAARLPSGESAEARRRARQRQHRDPSRSHGSTIHFSCMTYVPSQPGGGGAARSSRQRER